MNVSAACPSLLFVLSILTAGASAGDATFDTFSEGVIAPTFSEGGITFSNLDCNLGPGPYSFIAEQADGTLAGMPGFTPNMCLAWTGYSPGQGAAFSRVLSFEMTPAQPATQARLEIFETGSYAGNSIALEAWSNGMLVQSHNLPIQPGFGIHHYTMAVSGVVFDTLRLVGQGPNDNGVFFGLVDGVSIGAPPTGTVLCPGDGSGTACPCGNHSPVGAGEGCTSSLGFGATLRAVGTPSLANDSLVLEGGQMPDAPCLYFQGTLVLAGGSVFGDGLRCAGGPVARLGTKFNQAGGSQYPQSGDVAISVRGQVASPGVRIYQVWYRNAASFCTPFTFNLTNGLEITWTP